jgi:hypothetical protein
MKLMFNGMEIEGTPEECASFKKLMDNQPKIKFTPNVQPYTQPYISPYTYPSTGTPTTNPFKWNEITCGTSYGGITYCN